MNRKKEIIKLIIYLIIIVLVNVIYYFIKEASITEIQCIQAPCDPIETFNITPYLIGCILISCIFGVLSIITIIKLIKNK